MQRDLQLKSRSSLQKTRLDLKRPSQKEFEDTQQYLFSPYYTSVLEILNSLASTSLLSRATLEQLHLIMKKGERPCL